MQEHTRLVGDCFGVHISIFKLHQILSIFYFSKFYYSFVKIYLLPNILKNHQKIYETPQIIDLLNEHRVFVLLETRTRYFNETDFKRRENGFQVYPLLNSFVS